MSEKLYTIGKAAALCNLSETQLRNYDKMGLLSPEVRGGNNYRYYTEKQLEQILIIKELKNYGVPLKMIEELMKDTSLDRIRQTLEEMLLEQRAEMYKIIRKYDEIIDRLLALNRAHIARDRQEMLTEGSDEGFSIAAIAERPIISIRQKSKSYMTQHYTERYLELQNLIEQRDVRTGRSWLYAYHDSYDCIFDRGEDAEADMEFFVNVESGDPAAFTRIFGGFQAAVATYLGAYTDERHKQTYEALAAWAKSLGYKVSGISYQEQLIGRNVTDREDQFVTKIYLPLNTTIF